jgi:hypothetical protein
MESSFPLKRKKKFENLHTHKIASLHMNVMPSCKKYIRGRGENCECKQSQKKTPRSYIFTEMDQITRYL